MLVTASRQTLLFFILKKNAMLDFTINGKELAIGFSLLAGLLGIVIIALRYYLTQTGKNLDIKEIIHPAARNKRPEVDALRWTGTIFRGGMAVALTMTILAFSWTTTEKKVFIPEDAYIDDIMEVIPPTSDFRQPPPPPPPPPKLEIVPDIEPIEDPVFVDNSIDVDDVVDVKPIVKMDKPTPPVIAPPEREEDVAPLKFAEQMPRFLSNKCESGSSDEEIRQCAQGEMLQFIYKNIKYPSIAKENGIEGTVVIRFVVSKKGEVQDATIVKDVAGGCGKEALRVVKLMSKWKAGRQGGRNVPVYFNLPVKFQLQ